MVLARAASGLLLLLLGAFEWLLLWPCTTLLSFPQSLQSDKEALQEGRGAVFKYRRTPDGYIQIGTAGCGVLSCPLGFITQPIASPSRESRPSVLFTWQRVISAWQEPGWNRI